MPDASPERALAHVAARARGALPEATRKCLALGAAHLAAAAREHGRITLSFHPDRYTADERSVAEGLLRDGVYRSQFETRISNGSLTAFPGGHRDDWERALFGDAYDGTEGRPTYGGLNLLDHPEGACPRFGSSHLRLRPHVLRRSTFTFGDSYLGPEQVATLDAIDVILAVVFDEVASTQRALGVKVNGPATMVERLTASLGPRRAVARPTVGSLDDYIEAQVHGPVRLEEDVEALVVDPSFRGTALEGTLRALVDRYALELEWHPGWKASPSSLSPDFRGPEVVELAHRVAQHFDAAHLDAHLLGLAAREALRPVSPWSDWGTPEELLQGIKRVWHCVVHFGVAHATPCP